MQYLIRLLSNRPPLAAVAGLMMLCAAAAIPAAGAAPAPLPDSTVPDSTVDDARAAAVRDARAGRVAEAYRRLEALYAEHPASHALRLDLAVVAAWAGHDQRNLELLDTLAIDALPDYVLESYAKSARNRTRWDEALAGYAALERRAPARAEFALARILVLADADRFGEARKAAAALLGRQQGDDTALADALFAQGYVEERARRFTRALGCFDRALALDPDHREARRHRILTASALGATRQALDAANSHPGLLTDTEKHRLELDAAAMDVRWASLPDGEGHEHAVSALAAQAALLRETSLADAATPPGRALRYDRVAALAAAGRPQQAVQAFEDLAREPGATPTADADLPVYLLAAAADAYLRVQRPERAAALYRAAVRRAPERFELQVGLFYAYSDLHDYEAATALAADMLAAQPAWHHPRPGAWQPNPRYARSREIAALELAFRDRYADALHAFDDMLAVAPGNTSLRLSRASVLRWRGWPSAAGRDVQRVLAREPGSLRASLLEAELALDTRHYRRAEHLLDEVVLRAPHAPGTRDLAGRWRRHTQPQVTVNATAGRSRGGGFASREWRTETYAFTAPVSHDYRLFAHHLTSRARFDEGIGEDTRLGAGIERRRPHWIWRTEVSRGLADNDDTGAALAVDWLVDDRVSFGIQAESNAVDVPLRGTRTGVNGDAVTLSARYRWHEGRDARATAGGLDTSDGNERRWVQLALSQRLLTLPRHKLVATTRAYASRNSATDRVYFNPESDRELSAGLTHEWRLFQHYDRGLTQRLGIEVGDYHQQGFGGAAVWNVFVEHAWQLGPRARLRYGLRTGERVYDGDREQQTSAFLGMEWRP